MKREADIGDATGQRARHGHQLRADPTLRQAAVPRRHPAQRRPQPVQPARVGRVADRATDIRPMRQRADAGRDRTGRSTARATRRQPRIVGIARRSMQRVVGEPADRESGCVGPPDHDRPGPAKIGDHRAVGRRQQMLLCEQPVGGGVSGHVGIYLHGDRHTRHRTRITPGYRRVNCRRLRQRLLVAYLHDGVEGGIHPIEPVQRALHRLGRAQPPAANGFGYGGGGHLPRFGLVRFGHDHTLAHELK